MTVFFKYSVSNRSDRVFQAFSLKIRWSKPVETGTVVVTCETADAITFRACSSCSPTLKIHVHLPECLTLLFALLDYFRRAVTDFISRLDVKRRRRRLAVQSTDVATIEGWRVRIPAGIVYNLLFSRLSGGPTVV